MERQIRVTVNDQTERFHLGLKVKHAIGNHLAKEVRAQRAYVRDADGNRYELEGALFDGQTLYVVTVSPEDF